MYLHETICLCYTRMYDLTFSVANNQPNTSKCWLLLVSLSVLLRHLGRQLTYVQSVFCVLKITKGAKKLKCLFNF